jgi:hypothetical protein
VTARGRARCDGCRLPLADPRRVLCGGCLEAARRLYAAAAGRGWALARGGTGSGWDAPR